MLGKIYFLCFLLITISPQNAKAADNKKDFYIVFLKDQPVDNEELTRQKHIDLLSSLMGSALEAAKSHLYSYTRIFNAFSAKLSEDEAEELSRKLEVANVILNRYRKLHTTRSWEFIGLLPTATRNPKVESNIIIGVLDTGITPQSQSFRDIGLGPPPAKWKGNCLKFSNFSGCNNKLIGAKYFKLDETDDPGDILSPIDVDGHGTHTSSTLAGSLVSEASLYGLARGVARGAVPSARVAAYKVCWASSGCSDQDILAAFEAAIVDGVDVISISIGGLTGSYTSDVIAVGSFHAMRRGIITVASAGNDGPNYKTVSNHAPWILTVGASGIDRQFRSRVVLGNGHNISGIGVSMFEPKRESYPITTGEDVARSSGARDAAKYCVDGSMEPGKVKGKIIYCVLSNWGSDSVVKGLGGIGAVIESSQFLDSAPIFMAPATIVNNTVGKKITDYIHSTRSPSAVIHKSEEIKIEAPFLASFSARGPNPGTRRVLKPDVVAPGIDILASYTTMKSLTGLKGDTQFSEFTLMSGTSMACPHVAGAAAYVKSFHPDWSASAIKSAILTTATPMSSRVDKEAEFGYGAGQVNPTKAKSPGLVYDMEDMSYIQFLCHEGGYDSSSLSILAGRPVNCSKLIPGTGEDALNYPTFQLALKNNTDHRGATLVVFRRTVTNVGEARSDYNVTTRAPKGVEISVKPRTLSFSRVGQKRSFKVEVKASPLPRSALLVSGSLVWRSTRHIVRSPIVIYNPKDFE